jgi:acetyltransferase-like isoleucine patch superfamily enzyme
LGYKFYGYSILLLSIDTGAKIYLARWAVRNGPCPNSTIETASRLARKLCNDMKERRKSFGTVIREVRFVAMHLLRLPLFSLRNCKVAISSWVEMGAVLVDSTVGSYSYVAGEVYLTATRVGNYCSIASGSKIGGMEHAWWWGSTSTRLSDRHNAERETVIEDDVWIGSNVVVRQGLRVGRGAVLGAGSVVLRDVPPYTIVAGVPAKVIRKRFSEDIIQQVLATKFWEHPPDKARDLLEAIKFQANLYPSKLSLS